MAGKEERQKAAERARKRRAELDANLAALRQQGGRREGELPPARPIDQHPELARHQPEFAVPNEQAEEVNPEDQPLIPPPPQEEPDAEPKRWYDFGLPPVWRGGLLIAGLFVVAGVLIATGGGAPIGAAILGFMGFSLIGGTAGAITTGILAITTVLAPAPLFIAAALRYVGKRIENAFRNLVKKAKDAWNAPAAAPQQVYAQREKYAFWLGVISLIAGAVLFFIVPPVGIALLVLSGASFIYSYFRKPLTRLFNAIVSLLSAITNRIAGAIEARRERQAKLAAVQQAVKNVLKERLPHDYPQVRNDIERVAMQAVNRAVAKLPADQEINIRELIYKITTDMDLLTEVRLKYYGDNEAGFRDFLVQQIAESAVYTYIGIPLVAQPRHPHGAMAQLMQPEHARIQAVSDIISQAIRAEYQAQGAVAPEDNSFQQSVRMMSVTIEQAAKQPGDQTPQDAAYYTAYDVISSSLFNEMGIDGQRAGKIAHEVADRICEQYADMPAPVPAPVPAGPQQRQPIAQPAHPAAVARAQAVAADAEEQPGAEPRQP